jgi:hypothetical protein
MLVLLLIGSEKYKDIAICSGVSFIPLKGNSLLDKQLLGVTDTLTQEHHETYELIRQGNYAKSGNPGGGGETVSALEIGDESHRIGTNGEQL